MQDQDHGTQAGSTAGSTAGTPAASPAVETAAGHAAAPSPQLRVKICGVTRAEDARVAEAAGADAVGMIFAERSVRRLTLDGARAVSAALGPFVTRVGVFLDQDETFVREAISAARLQAVQLHGEVDDDVAASLRATGVQVIRAVSFTPEVVPNAFVGRPFDAILLDGLRPGSGEAFDWDAASAWRGHASLILAGGLTPTTVGDAVRALRPAAVDVASGVEAAPGVKDPELVRAFVRAARAV